MRFTTTLILLALPRIAAASDSLAPPPGPEALGHGGAFTARADSPLALSYNVAGLAQLVGTQVAAGVHLSSFDVFGCRRSDRREPCFSPSFGISTDFGFFKRWTFGAGLEVPTVLNRYSYWALSAQSPYAYYQGPFPGYSLYTPMLGAAVRLSRRLSLGVLVGDVVATAPRGSCHDFPPTDICEVPQVASSAWNPILQLGVLAQLGSSWRLGLDLRSAPNLGLHAIGPAEQPITDLPWLLRLGGRYARPRFDVELDAVAQVWTDPERPRVGLFGIPLGSHTLGVRLGASYTPPLGGGLLALRGGALLDNSLPWGEPWEDLFHPRQGKQLPLGIQRTLTFAVTAGFSLTYHGASLDLAYAYQRSHLYSTYANIASILKEPEDHILSLGFRLNFNALRSHSP